MILTWPYVTPINALGAPIDFEAFQEIKTNVDLVAAAVGNSSGASTFNGRTGRAVTVSPAMANTSYLPIVTPSGVPDGNIGDIGVQIDSTSQFTVFCSGNSTGPFRWKVVP
jgi:hypothetical protein